MARVTVEDCVENISNRFELVIIASERAKNLSSGSTPTVEVDNDKSPVIALREIAANNINIDLLREAVIQINQKYATFEPEIDDDTQITSEELAGASEELSDNLDENNLDASQEELLESDQDDVHDDNIDDYSYSDDVDPLD
ncbi:MAG: DNA-directed RNA polymerase subunit omega [Pseudomonadota bacterium]